MASFEVTIIKTITTVIRVDAESKDEAKTQIRDYGLIESTSDYWVIDETVDAKLGKIVKL